MNEDMRWENTCPQCKRHRRNCDCDLTAGMTSPLGIEVKVGQVWEELDARFNPPRLVEIVGFDRKGNVRVKCKRVVEAQLKRFNGKRGGYRLVGI